MSEEDRAWGQYAEAVPEERALAVLSGTEPYTTREVAAAMNATEHTARAALESLEDRGAVGRKQLRAETAPLTVWYRTRPGVGNEPEEGETPDVIEHVEAMLEEMTVPGTSEMMRDWRRDAIRAAFEHLREAGEVPVPEFREAVYPAHRAGCEDFETWWDLVRPRLRRFPGVVNPAWGEDTWRYEGQ